MAEADVITVRSLEDVAYLLNILFFNMNNLSKVYYDMFINPEKMDIELQRYDESGTLKTIVLPNRAKDKIQTYVGNGNPNGNVIAGIGALYIDSLTSELYYKASGSESYGWILLYSEDNLNYLKPSGDGSRLTNLNANSITSGTLPVSRGGTGTSNISGLIKGNGIGAFTGAEDGVDYLGPAAVTGLICYYPVQVPPKGWLLCDGRSISRVQYSRLFNKIGTQYGAGDGATTFGIPNLMGYFVRGWDNTRDINVPQEGAVGGHTHQFTGSTGPGTAHSHTRGTMNIEGTLWGESSSASGWSEITGAFYKTDTSRRWGHDSHDNDNTDMGFDASRSWTGSTSEENSHTHALSGNTLNNATGVENMVRNMPLFPIIKD